MMLISPQERFTRAQRAKIRKITRIRKRELKHEGFAAVGLNGTQAMQRRRRQIKAGSLKNANGLVRKSRARKAA